MHKSIADRFSEEQRNKFHLLLVHLQLVTPPPKLLDWSSGHRHQINEVPLWLLAIWSVVSTM